MLWRDVVKEAEDRCSINLQEELETYLISLLIRYLDNPEMTQRIFAVAFMEALKRGAKERQVSLQNVGDECLLFAGLFPKAALPRQVTIKYFVDLGRTAYFSISNKNNDLYTALAFQFVVLMDVLQSIPNQTPLLPLEAYEQWQTLGSQRALEILKSYTQSKIAPFIYPK